MTLRGRVVEGCWKNASTRPSSLAVKLLKIVHAVGELSTSAGNVSDAAPLQSFKPRLCACDQPLKTIHGFDAQFEVSTTGVKSHSRWEGPVNSEVSPVLLAIALQTIVRGRKRALSVVQPEATSHWVEWVKLTVTRTARSFSSYTRPMDELCYYYHMTNCRHFTR